jgi:hypothetical protein
MEEELKERREERVCDCPMCQLIAGLKKGMGKKSQFRRHLYRSKVEFLKAIRALIDERIEELEGKAEERPRQAVKVAVE